MAAATGADRAPAGLAVQAHRVAERGITPEQQKPLELPIYGRLKRAARRGGRVVEGARLERV